MVQAAAIAFAQDVGAGIAKPSGPVASSSTPRKPPPKPSNPYANYSTAASLGYTDPDADRIAEEMRIRQTQGVAGDWEVVTSTAQESSSSIAQDSDTTASTTADMIAGAEIRTKREAEGPPVEEDIRAFKLRKKQLTAGLGEIYDPGLIPVKKKEEIQDTPLPASSSSLNTESEPVPKWTPIQLAKRPDHDSRNGDPVTTLKEEEDTSKADPSSKWAKAKWSDPIPDIPVADRTSVFGLNSQEPDVQTPEGGKGEIKLEEHEMKVEEDPVSKDAVPNDGGVGGVKFKKRRAPANIGRGRREV